MKFHYNPYLVLALLITPLTFLNQIEAFRVLDGAQRNLQDSMQQQGTKVAVFALGSFWRAEAAFGCLTGVIRTTAGYCGGTKTNPEFRLPGDHAEAVEVEYNPKVIRYEQLLDVFWSSHDPTQVFGQGPDVGDQYRSIIFTSERDEVKLATISKEREQTRLRDHLVMTKIQPLETFYVAEPEHQKFELRRNPTLVQLLGVISEEDYVRSTTATKMNSYAAKMCPPVEQKAIDAKLQDVLKYWPLTRVLNYARVKNM